MLSISGIDYFLALSTLLFRLNVYHWIYRRLNQVIFYVDVILALICSQSRRRGIQNASENKRRRGIVNVNIFNVLNIFNFCFKWNYLHDNYLFNLLLFHLCIWSSISFIQSAMLKTSISCSRREGSKWGCF